MTTSAWLLYLAAATACQAILALFYVLALARLRTLALNRAYLLGALVLGAALPLVALPDTWARWLWPAAPVAAGSGLGWAAAGSALGPAAAPAGGGGPAVPGWESLLLAAYWLGMAWQVGRTVRGLGWLYRLRRYPRTRLGRGWLVQLPAPGWPAFSFGRSVFLSPVHARLGAAEYAQLLAHEQVHGQQYHSLDLLLAEVLGWFFWFNGLVGYLRRQLRAVHEYLADDAVAQAGNRTAYGHLLLTLAAGPLPASLVHPFAARRVAQRIHMLILPPSSTMQKLRFLLVVPVVTLAWLGTAALQPTPALATAPAAAGFGKTQSRIASISWQGNTYLSAAQLTEALGLKPGDFYNPEAVSAQLHYRPGGQDVESRYMDHGYLFFQVETVAKTRPDGSTDLTFVLNEGRPFRTNVLSVRGNHRIAAADILRLVSLHQGEVFNRSKLVASQRALAESGQFVPTQIGVNPQPLPDAGLVNVEFVVVEK